MLDLLRTVILYIADEIVVSMEHLRHVRLLKAGLRFSCRRSGYLCPRIQPQQHSQERPGQLPPFQRKHRGGDDA
jgi:hypothetical protein